MYFIRPRLPFEAVAAFGWVLSICSPSYLALLVHSLFSFSFIALGGGSEGKGF